MISETIGEQFHKNIKYERGKLPRGRLALTKRPPLQKSYENVSKISLPSPSTSDGPGLWELLRRRRSVRMFSGKPMSKKDLSQILWAIQGVTKPSVPAYGGRIGLRTAPSAGALYPIETYLCINNVDDMEPGLYHYKADSGELELLQEGTFGMKLADTALEQTVLANGNVVFIWAAVFERSKWKYRQRAFRYVFLDAGHIAQNLALAAEGLGMGSCQVAVFYDDEVNQLLQLDGKNESVIILVSLVIKRKDERCQNTSIDLRFCCWLLYSE